MRWWGSVAEIDKNRLPIIISTNKYSLNGHLIVMATVISVKGSCLCVNDGLSISPNSSK